MAASAGAVRAGGAFIEIFAKDVAFQQAMTRVQNRLKAVSASMRQIGNNMAIGGAAMAAPLLAAVNGARRFEDALLDAKASAGLTAAEMERVRQKALELSQAGVGGPGEIAEAFTAIIKAGMPLEQALGGAAEAVVKFASNAGIDTQRAAEIASDAMNVFGESTTSATDILKAAADSSSTDINQMTQAFSQSSAVAGQAGQSMSTLSAALAIMASQGVKGSDAGTSLKTMIQRLTTGADTAAEAMAEIGLGVASFRDARGGVLPLAQVMDILNAKLGTLDKASRDNVMARIFGTDAIRAAQILTTAGSAGFKAMGDQMAKSMSNADAFNERMSGISGAVRRLNSAMERLSVAVSGGLGTAIGSVEKGLVAFVNAVSWLADRFPVVTQAVAGAAGFLLAFGLAAKVAGFALSGVAQAFSLLKMLPSLLTPMGLITTAIVGIGVGGVMAARSLSPAFKEETDAIWKAITQLDFASAWQIMNLNFSIALAQMGAAASKFWGTIQGTFASAGSFIGDKLAEGLDRFMGLFGADIITLQNGFERLGIYFRAAFDWKFALTGMSAALKAADAAAEKARARTPTADARAADRAAARQRAADGRQTAMDKDAEGWGATVEELRKDLARAKDSLNKPAEAKGDSAESVAKNFMDQFRQPGEFTPGGSGTAAAGAAATSIGQTLGTFASSAEGLGIGPELNKLEQPAIQTAANTARAAVALEQMVAANRIEPAAAGGGGVAAQVAAPQAGPVAATVRAGVAMADWSGIAPIIGEGQKAVVAAIQEHAKLTAAGNGHLARIDQKLSSGGLAFS
jgi:TP901 family phage tail tape measure protein